MGAALADGSLIGVVNVSGGNWVAEGLGGAVVFGVGGAVVSVRGGGAPTVALVDALSPLLTTTAVATAPSATTAPRIATTGRQRVSAGQASSP